MVDVAGQPAAGGLLDALESAWQRAKGLTAKDVQTGLDAASLATTAWPVVGDAVGLGADAYRYLTQPDERTPGNFAMTALGALPFVPSASALHAAGAAIPAAVGMLRKGGDASLIPWHQTRGISLLDALRGRGELTSPSIGISREAIPDKFFTGSGDAMLIPKVGAFDPGAYPATLFNRDAYTPRMGNYNSAQFLPGQREMAAARLADRDIGGELLRGTESFTTGPNGVIGKLPVEYQDIRQALGGDFHAIPVYDSPTFRNFASFERSPRGAGLLQSGAEVHNTDYIQNAREAYKRAFPNLTPYERDSAMQAVGQLLELQSKTKTPENMQKVLDRIDALPGLFPDLARMIDLDPNAVEKLQRFRGGLANSPSEYAELKVHGNTQISPEHFAGALIGLDQHGISNIGKAVSAALIKRGIPTQLIPAGSFYDSRQAFELANELQREAGLARKSPL